MIVSNTTFCVEPSVEREFLDWLGSDYAAEAARCGHDRPRVHRILADMEGGRGYAVQLRMPSVDVAEAWHEGPGAALLSGIAARWGARVVYFTTMMEEVDL